MTGPWLARVHASPPPPTPRLTQKHTWRTPQAQAPVPPATRGALRSGPGPGRWQARQRLPAQRAHVRPEGLTQRRDACLHPWQGNACWRRRWHRNWRWCCTDAPALACAACNGAPAPAPTPTPAARACGSLPPTPPPARRAVSAAGREGGRGALAAVRGAAAAAAA